MEKRKISYMKQMWCAIKHTLQRDEMICPNCGNKPFLHGHFPNHEYYCTKCGLWEPDWDQRRKEMEELINV